MVPSLDCAFSSLLCSEDDIIFYDDLDDVYVYNDDDVEEEHRNHRIINQNQSFNGGEKALVFDDVLPFPSEECLTMMVKKECEHLPSSDYLMRFKNGDLDLDARLEAIDWIAKVHSHYNFGPLCAYLSISYLDRFLSAYELPGEAWMMQLTAVACLSLAAKMEETDVPLSLDLQIGESKYVFEAKTIKRMELLVLSTLNWRMQPVTPFSFLDSFLDKINGGDESISRSSINKSTDLILSTLREIDFLEFKPSEIAAAVAITQAEDNEKALAALIQLVDKERVIKCVESMKDLRGFASVPSVSMPSAPQSPIGVLDAARLCYKIDDAAVESCVNSAHNSPIAKRRKLNRPREVEL